MKAIYSCDWLELYCQVDLQEHPEGVFLCGTFQGSMGKYQIEHREYGTRVYGNIYDVSFYWRQEYVPLLTICSHPLSSILKGSDCHVKLHNYWLYVSGYIDILKHALGFLCIKPIQLSRCDICCDFQYTTCGLAAWDLLSGIVSHKYLKVHQPHWRLHAFDDCHTNKLYYNSLGFGSKSSSVYTRFYNKTLEMKQEKDKVYIRERWEQIGFDMDKSVYRVEFSLHDIGRKSVDKETGAIVEIEWERLDDLAYLGEQFRYYAAYYFDIRKNDNPRRDRCSKIPIFGQASGSYSAYQNPRYELSTRTDRLVLNYLSKNYSALAVTPQQMNVVTQAFANLMFAKRASVSDATIQLTAIRAAAMSVLSRVDDMMSQLAWMNVSEFSLPNALSVGELRKIADICDLRNTWEFFDYGDRIICRCYSILVK